MQIPKTENPGQNEKHKKTQEIFILILSRIFYSPWLLCRLRAASVYFEFIFRRLVFKVRDVKNNKCKKEWRKIRKDFSKNKEKLWRYVRNVWKIIFHKQENPQTFSICYLWSIKNVWKNSKDMKIQHYWVCIKNTNDTIFIMILCHENYSLGSNLCCLWYFMWNMNELQ